MNTICSQCLVEMNCTKTGVSVAHETNPQWLRGGDEFTCPNCGTKVIIPSSEGYQSSTTADVLVKEAISQAEVEVIESAINWMDEL